MNYKQLLLLTVTAVVIGCNQPPCRIVNTTQCTRNEHISMIWTLATRQPIGVAVISSDSNYSFHWIEQPPQGGAATWDKIEITVGDEEGAFRWHGKAEVTDKGRGGYFEGWSDGHSGIFAFSFTNIKTKGPVHIGDNLGSFSFMRSDSAAVSGLVTVVSADWRDTQQASGGTKPLRDETATSSQQTQKQQPRSPQEDVAHKGYVALCAAHPTVKWQAKPFSVQDTDVRWVLTFVPAERGQGPQSYIVWVDKVSGEARPVGTR